MDPITVLIAAAHAPLRQRLSRLLAQHGDIEVVGEVAHGRQVLSGVEACQPHILLLDVHMPKIGGLTGLPGIRANSPRTKTLFLADFCDEEFINQALQHGAEGCLPKTAPPTELLKAVRTAHAGELWAQRRLVTRVVKSLCQRIDELQESLSWIRQVLTNREQEVLAWTAQGMTNKEIAAQLSISEKTVKTHLQNIFRKLNVRRRAQLPHFRLASPSRPAAITPGHPPSK